MTAGSPDPEQEAPVLDVFALRRRVLLAAVLALGSFVAIGMLVVAVGAPDWYLLVGMALVWVLVVRPVMRPVREAVRLRRRLAFLAWQEQREQSGG